MRRCAAFTCALALLALLPALSRGQMQGPMPLPMPAPMCAPMAVPRPACPPPMPCLAREIMGTLDGSGGMQTVDLSFSTNGGPVGGIQRIEHHYQFGGIWLGKAASTYLTPRLLVGVDSALVIPFETVDHENNVFAPGAIGGDRKWKVSHTAFHLDGFAMWDLSPGTSFIAGFRWDYFTVNFRDPFGVSGVPGLPSDRADMTENLYLPFVGLQMRRYLGAGRYATFRIIGFPALWGDVKYNQTFGAGAPGGARLRVLGSSDSGYFLDVTGEYGVRSFSRSVASLFGKITTYHGTGRVAASVDLAGGGTGGSDSFALGVNRFTWALGMKFEIPFYSPL